MEVCAGGNRVHDIHILVLGLSNTCFPCKQLDHIVKDFLYKPPDEEEKPPPPQQVAPKGGEPSLPHDQELKVNKGDAPSNGIKEKTCLDKGKGRMTTSLRQRPKPPFKPLSSNNG